MPSPRAYKTKACQNCRKEYQPTSANQKYCAECGPAAKAEQRRVSSAKWYEENREKHRASDSKRRKENREERRVQGAKWREENPEKDKVINARHKAKHRGLGFIPRNLWFPGCEGDHLSDGESVVYIPKALHRSIYHNHTTGQGMAEMDALALAYAGLPADVLDDTLPFD